MPTEHQFKKGRWDFIVLFFWFFDLNDDGAEPYIGNKL
jgi:hypothetical protein